MEKCRSTYQRGGHFFDGAGTSRGHRCFQAKQGREQHTGGTLYMLCAVQLWSIADVDYPQKRG